MVAAVVIAAVGASRIFLGVHFFSDIVGGIAFGALLALSTAWVVERVRPGFLSVAGGAAVGEPETEGRRAHEEQAQDAEVHDVVAGSVERDPVLVSGR